MILENGVIVFGAGGHAKVAIDVLLSAGRPVVACITPDGGGALAGIPILSESSGLPDLLAKGYRAAFVAIGDNRIRRREAIRLRLNGLQLVNAVSPRAYIAENVWFGTGILVMHGVVINSGSRIDDDAIINTASSVDHDNRIGAGVHIAPGSHLAGTVTVADGAFIGIGSVVLPGLTIGRGAVVGAGSVVVEDVAEYHRAWGNPARDKGRRQDDHD